MCVYISVCVCVCVFVKTLLQQQWSAVGTNRQSSVDMVKTKTSLRYFLSFKLLIIIPLGSGTPDRTDVDLSLNSDESKVKNYPE